MVTISLCSRQVFVWQPQDWLLLFYLIVCCVAIYAKVRAIAAHRRQWPVNWLRLIAIFACAWTAVLTIRAIGDVPRAPNAEIIVVQIVPVVLLVALEAAHGWIEW